MNNQKNPEASDNKANVGGTPTMQPDQQKGGISQDQLKNQEKTVTDNPKPLKEDSDLASEENSNL